MSDRYTIVVEAAYGEAIDLAALVKTIEAAPEAWNVEAAAAGDRMLAASAIRDARERLESALRLIEAAAPDAGGAE